MRHLTAAFALSLCVFVARPCLAAGADTSDTSGEAIPANAPRQADVLEYIRLFGYRQMLKVSAERQLDVVIELVRQSHQDIAPGVLELIHKELQTELEVATEAAVLDMAPVFQRHLTREDVAYLLTVGRDPRMQKVVALQPRIAEDMEAVGERLAEEITSKAAPRIEERLKKLESGQRL